MQQKNCDKCAFAYYLCKTSQIDDFLEKKRAIKATRQRILLRPLRQVVAI